MFGYTAADWAGMEKVAFLRMYAFAVMEQGVYGAEAAREANEAWEAIQGSIGESTRKRSPN